MEEYDFVNGLCILFNEVDINGDGTMEWDEFASFIIEAVDSNHMQAQAGASALESDIRNPGVMAVQ